MSKCGECIHEDTHSLLCHMKRNQSWTSDFYCSDFHSTTKIRTFPTGATRDTDADKLDFEGFLSPLVLVRYAEYMNKHRKQSDGQLRDSDNWQKGIPQAQYMKSAWRHFMDWWLEHRGHKSREGLEDALCGLLFNVAGYLHESLKVKQEKADDA